MIQKLTDWLDDRTGYKQLLQEALFERIPGGARWRYVWGSTLVFTFFVQVVTGVLLWAAYSPSTQTAWESVYYIQDVMFLGWLIRGIHHFTAQAMVVLLAIHLIQVIVDGAYKAPREINYWLGLVLMQIVLGLSLTGYLLPWHQKGYYATKVATNIAGATPVIGTQLQELAQGGSEYGHHTLTRFFAMHAGVLPGLLIAFLAIHIYVFRRHGITTPDPNRAPDTTFWPDQVLKDGVACLGVLAVVLLLTIFKGAELGAPADPSDAYSAARPEWYFLFLFRFLKFEAIEHFGVAFGAIYIPGLLMTILALMPVFALKRGGHRFNVAFMCLISVGVVGLTVLSWVEDARDTKHQDALHSAELDAKRIRVLAAKPALIPVEGAVSLLRSDPYTQGSKLFVKKCAVCHSYNDLNGRGGHMAEKPTAADLGDFGSRSWIRSVLTDFKARFAPLGTEYLSESQMADWSDSNKEELLKESNQESLAALVEFIHAQALAPGDPTINAKLAKTGREIFTSGELADGSIDACADCHSLHAVGEERALAEDGDAPNLTGYASKVWLKDFIANPGTEQNYGENNTMPAFEETMSEQERDFVVRWMTGDYYRPAVDGEQATESH